MPRPASARTVAVTLLVAAVLGMGACAGEEEATPVEPSPVNPNAARACELLAKADEALEVHDASRYAAALLLLDTALVESEHAATADASYADLDAAIRKAHSTAHDTRPPGSLAAMADEVAKVVEVCVALPE